MDRFTEMRIFARVVEMGSLSAAAERLDIARSAVSRRLADLEARLGVELLHRTTRRISLTESGREYYERCVRILADLEEADLSVSRAHSALRGSLRVAMPLSFGLTRLQPIIQDFMALHPQVNFDLDCDDRHVDLLREGFDVGIRIARLEDSSFIARRLCPIRHVVCASPAYLAAHGTPRHADELARHQCLAYSNQANPELWSYRRPDGEPAQARIGVRLRANNGDLLVKAAVAGSGIILIPSFYVHELLARGELVAILQDHSWPELNAYALYPPTRHLSSRVRAFVDFLAERLRGTPPWDAP